MTKVSPLCRTVLFPSWVQIICEGGLLDALQKEITLSYSRTVLFLGAKTISAASEIRSISTTITIFTKKRDIQKPPTLKELFIKVARKYTSM